MTGYHMADPLRPGQATVTVTPALLVPDLLSGSFGISHCSRLGILRKLIGGGVGTLGVHIGAFLSRECGDEECFDLLDLGLITSDASRAPGTRNSRL
jgi:hypothetical protein